MGNKQTLLAIAMKKVGLMIVPVFWVYIGKLTEMKNTPRKQSERHLNLKPQQDKS